MSDKLSVPEVSRRTAPRSKHFWYILLSALFISAGILALDLPSSRAQEQAELIAPADVQACLDCHSDGVDHARLKGSAHGKLTCQQCHKGVNQYPHPEKAVARKPACADCHAKISTAFAGSAHRPAQGKNVPACATCHGQEAHAIARSSAQTPAKQQAACLQCHKNAGAALQGSVHGKAKLTCRDCHGADPHTIKPGAVTSLAAKSAACTTCHKHAGQAVKGSVHQGAITCTACHGHDAHAITAPASSGNAACAACHGDVQQMVAKSVHGGGGKDAPTCASCHGKDTHRVAHGGTAAQRSASCRACHADVVKSLQGAAHGRPDTGPECLSCHTEHAHAIAKPAMLTGAQQTAKCESCHTEVAKTLQQSVHGASAGPHGAPKSGERPTCQSCHGATMHAVKPAATLKSAPGASCQTCHDDKAQALTQSVHARAGIKLGSASTCLSCHGKGPHAVSTAAGAAATAAGESCISCHPAEAEAYRKSVHARPDKRPGDHPTCVSCHGNDIHGMQRTADLSITGKVALCSQCHENPERMARYGLTTDAYSSYRQSFHGRAALDFNKANAATCTDCHGLHGVKSPSDPEAPTGVNHVVDTCGKCHPGAQMNFAMSGANHLRMKIANTPLLHMLEIGFKTLMFGAMAFLFGLVLLDLRRKLFSLQCVPACGRVICALIAASLLTLVGGIALGFAGIPGAGKAWLVSVGFMAVAFIIYAIERKKLPRHHDEGPHYPRLNRVLRIQHILLASSFTLLVLTGFPLHFAEIQWTHYLLLPFGGFDGARIVHRVAGVLMVVNWLWHLSYLLLLWKRAKFSLRSWTMFPTLKDARDLWGTVTYGLGISNTPPQFDRFQFREKFDYFADMWGTLVMGISGLIMWFPTLANKVLPDVAFGAAYIAHSYEGMLALMAIIVWHFYNTHFNPDTFPMNSAWLTGTMSAEEMEREHPLEKARLDALAAKRAPGETTDPVLPG